MKIILAPDSFKGTFTSKEVIRYLDQGIRKHIDDVELIHVPIADGGEGTVDALLTATNGERIYTIVEDPLGRDIEAYYGRIGDTAIIEMAIASGITLVREEERDPLKTSTYGTGQLMKHALDHGARKLIIGIGGSATNDGGMGMAKALGARFFDADSNEIGQGGIDLGRLKLINTDNLDSRLKEVTVEVICDVTNPLTGPEGASYTYGPQKGASPNELEILENAMLNYHQIIEDSFGLRLNDIDGSGAAGGLGGGLVVFAQAELKPGIETILDTVGFNDLLTNTDMVITGEGKLDGQSIYGKVPVGVAGRCGNIPVYAFCGALGENAEKVYDYNIAAIYSTVSDIISFDDIVANKEKIMEQSVDRFVRLIKASMRIMLNK